LSRDNYGFVGPDGATGITLLGSMDQMSALCTKIVYVGWNWSHTKAPMTAKRSAVGCRKIHDAGQTPFLCLSCCQVQSTRYESSIMF
jgi:ABC-type cobalamin transport system ATPase subunit